MESRLSKLNPSSPRSIFCWCFFDWANSAFPTVIVTFVFGTYFTRSVAPNEIIGTAIWGWTLGISGVLVALLSPIFGSIADYTHKRKHWLATFTLLNIVLTALLFLVRPHPTDILLAVILIICANIFYELTQVFYNAMLMTIAPKDKIGRISGWGWGLGYIGGLACLIIALFVFVRGHWLPNVMSLNIRSTNLLVAAWFLVFSIPLFLFTIDMQGEKVSLKEGLKKGLHELWHTFKNIRKYKSIFTFLIAHLVYIDGLNALFAFAAIFAAGTYNMSYTQILLFAILLNLTAGIGAGIFAFVDDKMGPKFTICISLVSMIVIGALVLLTSNQSLFWILASIIGIFVGPTQAASRSYMAHLTPEHLSNQMFGIYQFSGRITSFIGPILVGTFTDVFKSQRVGMSVIFVLMLIGFLILLAVPPVKRLDVKKI